MIPAVDIYEIHDRERAIKTVMLACQKGCAACCQQLVACTKLEWEPIEKYIKENGLKKTILMREMDAIKRWLDYRKANLAAFRDDPTKALREHRGVKCVFLNRENGCDVYPVRPMNCRVISSTTRCVGLKNPNCARFRWNFERALMETIWQSGQSMMINDCFLAMK